MGQQASTNTPTKTGALSTFKKAIGASNTNADFKKHEKAFDKAMEQWMQQDQSNNNTTATGDKSGQQPPGSPKLPTAFTRDELRYLFDSFNIASPNGYIARDEARTLFPYIRSEFLFTHVFRVLDKKKDDKIDFQEFASALSSISRGTMDEQLDITFKLFDLNEDQVVSKEEVRTVVTEVGNFLLKVAGGMFQKDEFLALREALATKIYGVHEKELPLEVFKQRSMSNKAILNCFGIFDFIFSHVVKNMEAEMGTKKVFGRSLAEILHAEGKEIPQFVQDAIKYIEDSLLDVEGIFRLNGDYLENKEAMSRVDQGLSLDFSKFKQQHVAPSLLKRFLRELPEPLFTYVYYNRLKHITQIEDQQKALEELSTVVVSLPEHHVNLLNHLATFLQKVDDHKERNLMGFDNLAAVFAPCLMRDKTHPSDPTAVFTDNEICIKVVKMVLENWGTLYKEAHDSESSVTVRSMERVIKSLRAELKATVKLKNVEIEQLKATLQARDLEIQKLKKELEAERLRQTADGLRAEIHRIQQDQPARVRDKEGTKVRPSTADKEKRAPKESTDHSGSPVHPDTDKVKEKDKEEKPEKQRLHVQGERARSKSSSQIEPAQEKTANGKGSSLSVPNSSPPVSPQLTANNSPRHRKAQTPKNEVTL